MHCQFGMTNYLALAITTQFLSFSPTFEFPQIIGGQQSSHRRAGQPYVFVNAQFLSKDLSGFDFSADLEAPPDPPIINDNSDNNNNNEQSQGSTNQGSETTSDGSSSVDSTNTSSSGGADNSQNTQSQFEILEYNRIIPDCHSASEVAKNIEYLCQVHCKDYYYRHSLQLPPLFACSVDSSQYDTFEAYHNCTDVTASYDKYEYDNYNYCRENQTQQTLQKDASINNLNHKVCSLKITFTTGPSMGSGTDCMKLTVNSRMSAHWLAPSIATLATTSALLFFIWNS